LCYQFIQRGEGKQAVAGKRFRTLWRIVRIWKVFDSSYPRKPIEFPLGQGNVIEGTKVFLRVGDKARFVIPSHLGYGSRGWGAIPPNATLILT
jgi:peptidyl-prolyl cis-trans isomerase A (cyclophilin A)